MVKGLLKDEEKDKYEDELEVLALMEDYLSKTSGTQLEFTSIRQMQEIDLGDGALRIPNILALQTTKGKTELLNITKQRYEKDEIDELSERTGLERKDIMLLLQDGMKLEEISESADNLPFKEIADSAAIREMIRKEIDPVQLSLMKKRGIEIVPASDGNLEISNIQKLAEIDEKGLMKLDPELMKSLEPFEEFGLIKLSDELVVKELEPEEKDQLGSLKVVSLEEKQADKTKEEIEKQKMARGIGIDPDQIVSLIRIDDREGGSKLLNDNRDENSTRYLVRTRAGAVSNKFIVAKETGDGKFEQIQGFEATPVGREVGAIVNDTHRSLEGSALKPGQIKAGKVSSMDTKYSFYQIRKKGNSMDDTTDTLLFVGTNGDTQTELIESRENGDKSFVRVPVSTVYPKSIYMENGLPSNKGKETNLVQEDKENPQEQAPESMSFKDISKKRDLLDKLIKIEKQIRAIEGQTGHDERCIDDCIRQEDEHDAQEIGFNSDIPESEGDPARRLPDLYDQRSTILTKLGIDEVSAVKAQEEEIEIGMNRRHH